MVGGGIDIVIGEIEKGEERFWSIVDVNFEEMSGMITLESGIPVSVIKSDETRLGKTDDGTMNGVNGRGTLKYWVSSIINEGVRCWNEIDRIEIGGEVKEW